MVKINIRKSELDDLEQINKIATQIHELHVNLRPDIYKPCDCLISLERYEELSKDGAIFVSEVENTIISYAICLIKIWDNPLTINKKVLLIDAIGNDSQYIKCGVGKQMMFYIFDYARREKCSKIELQVNAKNKNALDFYEHIGMKEKSRTLEFDL